MSKLNGKVAIVRVAPRALEPASPRRLMQRAAVVVNYASSREAADQWVDTYRFEIGPAGCRMT